LLVGLADIYGYSGYWHYFDITPSLDAPDDPNWVLTQMNEGMGGIPEGTGVDRRGGGGGSGGGAMDDRFDAQYILTQYLQHSKESVKDQTYTFSGSEVLPTNRNYSLTLQNVTMSNGQTEMFFDEVYIDISPDDELPSYWRTAKNGLLEYEKNGDKNTTLQNKFAQTFEFREFTTQKVVLRLSAYYTRNPNPDLTKPQFFESLTKWRSIVIGDMYNGNITPRAMEEMFPDATPVKPK
jgi:hypothetical protein